MRLTESMVRVKKPTSLENVDAMINTKLCSVDCMTSFVKQEKRAYKLTLTGYMSELTKFILSRDQMRGELAKVNNCLLFEETQDSSVACSRKRQVDVKKNTPALMKWHSNLREKLIKSACSKSTYDKKWGRFPPDKRLNVDQIPLPFVIESKRT